MTKSDTLPNYVREMAVSNDKTDRRLVNLLKVICQPSNTKALHKENPTAKRKDIIRHRRKSVLIDSSVGNLIPTGNRNKPTTPTIELQTFRNAL